MGIEYVALACGFVVLVVIVYILINFDAGAWIAKGLKRGDLYSLIDVASGLRPDGLTPMQAQRLMARGMVRSQGEGSYRATIRGRLALWLRQMVRRPQAEREVEIGSSDSHVATRRRSQR